MSSYDYAEYREGPETSLPPAQPGYYDSHTELGDAAVTVTLFKQSDFDLFHNGVHIPLSQMADYSAAVPDGFVFTMEGRDIPEFLPYHRDDWYQWTETPLKDREIPFLVFNIDHYQVEATHCYDLIPEVAAARQYDPGIWSDSNYWQYAKVTAPDGTVWIGCTGYTEGGPVYASRKHALKTIFPTG